MDFMSDQLATGRCFRILNVVDDYSQECVGQMVDFSISGQRSRPEAIVTDNGPEFTSKAMFLWSQRIGIDLRFIQPGKPIQNALVESFNGKFLDAASSVGDCSSKTITTTKCCAARRAWLW